MAVELIAGRYRVQRPVGRGGMGTVWLCRDEVLGREVAVKQVGRLPGESVPDTARALREARSSAALNHKNVVSVFDVVEADDEIWLVMEYVPSRTLSEILREEGPLTPERAALIGAQVADGLAAAHARETIHRDVKPGNVLVGDDDTAKISDFGIARTAGDQQLTSTGLMTGTPAYFSPELARGVDPGPAADVWALGATLYTAVEGAPPYPEQRNPLAMLQTISSQPVPSPVRAGPLADALNRMMDPDPQSRWTMADAAHALRRVAQRAPDTGHEQRTSVIPAPAPAPEPAPAPGPAEDRRRAGLVPWLVGAAVVAVLAGAVGLALSLGGPDTDPTAGPTAAEASSTPRPSPSPSPQDESPSPAESSDPAQDGQAMESFVEDYFAGMPADTDAGWQRLAPSMRSVGRGAYEDFWGSIDEVELDRVKAVPGSSAVDVRLTYSFQDGRVVTEEQRITLDRSGDGYLIADDRVLSSRTVRG